MADKRQASLAKESVPDDMDMKFILKAQHVYEELGSRKDCQPLIDSSPKLLMDKEVTLRLHKIDGKEKKCKVYIFDKFLIVASQRLRKRKDAEGNEISAGMTSASSSDQEVVWFGSKKESSNNTDSGSEKSPEVEDSSKNQAVDEYEDDSDVSDYYQNLEELDELDRAESEAKREMRKYNLKMWIDLRRVKARYSKSSSSFGITIIYASKKPEEIRPGEFRYETIVDQAEMWMESSQVAKDILGIIQEAINKNTLEILQNEGRELPDDRSSLQKKTMRVDGRVASSGTETESEPNSTESGTSRDNTKSARRKSNSRPDRLSESTSSTGTTSGKKKRRNLARGKQALRATQAYIANSELNFDENGNATHKSVLTLRDINKKYEQFMAEPDDKLEAEYTVSFKNPNLGFALSSGKSLGPFVCRLVPGGLAEASGVTLGDKVTLVNDHEITNEHTWNEAAKIIAQERDKGEVKITFVRKQKTEIAKQEKEKQQKQLEEEKRLAAEAAAEAEASNGEMSMAEIDVNDVPSDIDGVGGAVQPVDEANEAVLDREKKRSDLETIEFRRKTDDGSLTPKFTMRRKKTGKRRFAKKMQILNNMKYNVTTIKEFNELKKSKATLVDMYDNIDSLFDTVLGYLKGDKEKTCVYSLKEIYDTEYKYNTWINNIREFHVKLSQKKKNVICKNLKSGKPFCEHRRPMRFCNHKSSYRELAVDPKEVDSIFLNIKPIMKSNAYLWKNLQSKLHELYKQLDGGNGQKVEVYQLLEVFCTCFTEIAPFLQIYWQYCQRYTHACEKQKNLKNNNEYFCEVVEPLEKKIGMKLPNLLAKPVQRITRYHLLFTTLKGYAEKYVKEQSTGVQLSEQEKQVFNKMLGQLDEACAQLVTLAKKVNLKVGEADSLDQMVEVFGEIGGKEGIPNLLQPHRRFHSKYGVFYENTSKEEGEPQAVLYMFNDMLAIAVCRSIRSPSAFGSASKLSFPLRKLKNLSFGQRASSITNGKSNKKKISRLSGSKSDSKANKRNSVKRAQTKRTSNDDGKKNSPKKTSPSAGSKDSADEFYEVIIDVPLRTMKQLHSRNRKDDDDQDMFGIGFMYSRKHKDESETGQIFLYTDSAESREKIKGELEDLIEKDAEKKRQFDSVRDKVGKKRKVRNFKKKHDNFKKESLEKGKEKAKSSMYSGHSRSVGALKDV